MQKRPAVAVHAFDKAAGTIAIVDEVVEVRLEGHINGDGLSWEDLSNRLEFGLFNPTDGAVAAE